MSIRMPPVPFQMPWRLPDAFALDQHYTKYKGRNVALSIGKESHSLTKLASDAALLPTWVPPQHVLSPEAGTELPLFKGVVDLIHSTQM